MSDEVKETKKQRTLPVHVPPFSFKARVKPGEDLPSLVSDSTICIKPVAKVVEGHPGSTIPDFSDQSSVKKLIDSYKHETGLAYALRQINQGRLMPSQLFDKANGSADLASVPDNINDAYRQHLDAADAAEKVANGLGLSKLDEKSMNDAISKAVAQKFDAYIKANTKEVKKDE